MDGKKRFKAKIAGKDYTIVGSLPATHLNTVVDLVNQQINQLTELAPDLSDADRCVLMAVNAISDQFVKEKRIIELEAELAQSKNQTVPAKPSQTNDHRLNLNGRSTKGMIAGQSTNHSNSTYEAKAEHSEFPFKRK